MRDSTGKHNQKEATAELTIRLPAVVATSLQELVYTVGMHALDVLPRAAQTARCGLRYQPDPQRAANRHGSAPGELVLG